jgi:hypothetical protein
LAEEKAVSTPLDVVARLAAQQVNPLQLFRVEARGVPNQERIYFKANERVLLHDYLLFVGIRLPDGTAFPHPDHVLWLGNDTLEAGSWLIVYTGAGSRIVTFLRDSREPALVLYWGRPTVVFAETNLVPLLVRYERGSVQIGPPGA